MSDPDFIRPGTWFEEGNILIQIHFVNADQIYFAKYRKDEPPELETLGRMDVEDFKKAISGVKTWHWISEEEES